MFETGYRIPGSIHCDILWQSFTKLNLDASVLQWSGQTINQEELAFLGIRMIATSDTADNRSWVAVVDCRGTSTANPFMDTLFLTVSIKYCDFIPDVA